jgi:hypothetical protein
MHGSYKKCIHNFQWKKLRDNLADFRHIIQANTEEVKGWVVKWSRQAQNSVEEII